MNLPENSAFVSQPSKASSDATLFTRDWNVDDCRGIVYILHGFGEHCQRYNPFIKVLNDNKFTVYAHDHIGHGHSGGERVLIDHYDTYVEDALELIKRKKSENPGKPMILFGHSMGGLIATLCLIEKPELFDAAILCSACLQLTGKYNKLWMRTLSKIMSVVDPMFYLEDGNIDPNDVIADQFYRKDYMSDPMVWQYSNRAQSDQCMSDAMRKATQNMHQITVNMLVQHGTADKVCDVEAVKPFGDMPNATLKLYEGGLHVLLYDTHEIRQLTITDILEFLRSLTAT